MSFWKKLLPIGNEKVILCPYCLGETHYKGTIDQCGNQNCKGKLPPQYVQKYESALPFFVQIIGWSSVGKTVYLLALTYMLMNMDKFWLNFYSDPLTETSFEYVKSVREFKKKGSTPVPTQRNLQEPYIMLMPNMDRWGGRSLIMRDVAGEHFHDFIIDDEALKALPYLMHVPTTFFMISLSDMDPGGIHENKQINDLISNYVNSMSAYNRRFHDTRHNIVLVLSKADELGDRLPDQLKRYLLEDPLQAATKENIAPRPLGVSGMETYINEMRSTSRHIQMWVETLRGGRATVAMARDNNIHLEFSLVSSSGSRAESGSFVNDLTPMRVLDPFFWALDFQSK